MSPLVALLRSHPLASYFALTLGVVWATAPLALASPAGHGLLNAFTPALVAVLITAASTGAPGVRALLHHLLRWRVGRRWYAAALGLPVAIGATALALSALLGLPLTNPAGRLPATTLVFLTFVWLIAPGEELGWRGFALPRLLARSSALAAGVALGLAGAAFHLSAFVLPLIAPGHATPGQPFGAFLVQYVALAIVLNWIVIGARGSVLLACLWHGAFDVVGNVVHVAMDPAVGPWLWTGATALLAALVVAAAGPDLGVRRAAEGTLAAGAPVSS